MTAILDAIEKVPFEQIGNESRRTSRADHSEGRATLQADTQLMPQLKTDLDDLHRTLNAFEQAINNVN